MYPPLSMESELNNEKQVGCLGDLLGMILPSHVGDYLKTCKGFLSKNQDDSWKVRDPNFFFMAWGSRQAHLCRQVGERVHGWFYEASFGGQRGGIDKLGRC